MWPTRKEVDAIKARYPEGTRIRLIHMDDPEPITPGSEGTVNFVDDAGHLLMKWDDGRSIALMVNMDQFEIISQKNDQEVVYVDRKFDSMFHALRRADAEFSVGEMKEQYQGEDVSYHGSPVYETITVIQGDDRSYHHSNYATRIDPNRIEFVKVSELDPLKNAAIERIHHEIEELEQQIQMKKQEIDHVHMNSKKICQMLNEHSQIINVHQDIQPVDEALTEKVEEEMDMGMQMR